MRDITLRLVVAIAKNRLFPVGVAYASPVATNVTDEGRAKNRRVGLVEIPEAK